MIFSDLKNNRNGIVNSQHYINFVHKINKLMEFLYMLSCLISETGQVTICITRNKMHMFQPDLIDSSVKTLNSIKCCCMYGSFSDANILVRKFRDDLMLYLYILNVLSSRKSIDTEQVEKAFGDKIDNDKFIKIVEIALNNEIKGCMKNDDDILVDAWFDDNVYNLSRSQQKKLSINNYINYLEIDKSIAEILQKHNLKELWENIRRKLNSYTHNNGQSYTQDNIILDQDVNMKNLFTDIISRLDFLTSFFLILLILIKPSIIQSSDYIDYLDAGLTPIEGSQYKIAPFIQKFIDEYINKIHPELKVFLRDNNKYGMLID